MTVANKRLCSKAAARTQEVVRMMPHHDVRRVTARTAANPSLYKPKKSF